MKIKEIENITKLSRKTIRFYEEKGLLKVDRDESGYRHYTKEDIDKLMTLKLFRKCGLTIQEMTELIHHQRDLNDLLYDKISEYDKKDFDLSVRKELCLELIKAKGDYHDLYEDLDFIDSDQYHELIEDVMDISNVSLAQQILKTFLFLGPILSSFILLDMKNDDRLWISLLLSLISTVFLTLSWNRFFKNYQFQKETLWEGLLHFGGMILLFVITVISLLGAYMFINMLQTSLFMKGNVFILSFPRISSFILLLMGLEILILIWSIVGQKCKHRDYRQYNDLYPFFKKYKYILIIINIVVFYCAFMNLTTISPTEIVDYSPFHPFGEKYQFNQIKEVETGFYGPSFSLVHHQGDFYYKIRMKDGKSISIEDSQTLPQYEKHTYSELVELDRLIMAYKPFKKASDENSQYLQMDQEYIERFLSIVNHK